MRSVIDASITLSWYFEDERGTESDRVLDLVTEDGAVVPGPWRQEVANGFAPPYAVGASTPNSGTARCRPSPACRPGSMRRPSHGRASSLWRTASIRRGMTPPISNSRIAAPCPLLRPTATFATPPSDLGSLLWANDVVAAHGWQSYIRDNSGSDDHGCG